jgi:hypothetical protein
MCQKIIPTESTYGKDKNVFPKFIWQKSLGELHKKATEFMVAMKHISLAISFGY